MIIYHQQSHGCVYTIDPDTDELYYAPIYSNDTVNLNEFCPVDLFRIDEEDQKECNRIINQLKSYQSMTTV